MPNRITIDLIRRKAEHNEGLIHTLEELSLHQEELESIDDTLGCNCRRLKILYLQNNIIGEMKNLHHMKELEYLNLALNNITKVQGLESCEFLNKLDLTVNFVDLDELESSITAMEGNRHLGDLYMMGNPCQSWPGFESYVIARLPQLERLDGKEITRTDRIRAQQRLPALREEIVPLAEEVRRRKEAERRAAGGGDGDKSGDGNGDGGESGSGAGGDAGHPPAPGKSDGASAAAAAAVTTCATTSGRGNEKGGGGEGGRIGEEELTKHTPEVRTAIYREMAEQKKEKEDRQRENLPKDRNFELEQAAAVDRARKREAEGAIRQCNEARLEFRFEETLAGSGSGSGSGSGDIVLEVSVPKYLDSSLIDLDVHPHYVSVVIKGKVLRLSLQAEVKAGEAKARRSKTTGSLVVTMPKVSPDESIGLIPTDGRRRAPGVVADRAAASKNSARNDAGRTRRRGGATPTLAALMMEEARAAAASKGGREGGADGGDAAAETPLQPVSIRGIVGPRHGGLAAEAAPQLSEVASSVKRVGEGGTAGGEPPPQRAGAPGLPTPPPPPQPRHGGERTPASPEPRRKGTLPPAPPSGTPVSAAQGGGAGGVVWPRAEGS